MPGNDLENNNTGAMSLPSSEVELGTEVRGGEASSSTKAAVAVDVAACAGATLTASQADVLGLLSGVLTALPAVAPPPLNVCLMPFTIALAKLGLAVRQVRFNKEAAALLQRRGTEIAQKLQDVVKATQGLPTGQVEAVARTVMAIGQALDEAATFLQQFSKKGAFSKLLSGSLDARRFGLLDKRLCELSNELGSALDLQQLALQAQRFEKIEGLIQLLGQQTFDANNQAAAQRAAIMCGIPKGSAVEHEEFSALGLKLDRIAEDVNELKAGVQQLLANEGAAQERFVYDPYDSDDSDQEASLLGEGSFGTTHRMRNTDDGLVYAVKLIKIKKTGVPIEKLQQEAVRLSKLNHPNIVRYFTAFRLKKDKFFAIAMEYLAGGSLLAHIEQESGPLTSGQRQREAQTERWARQVASALAYMHALRMQHRDLKPDNVLFDEHQNARIIDLGLAEVVLAKSKVSSAGGANAVGALLYQSPEKARGRSYDGKDDVWALGCMVAGAVVGQSLEERSGGGVFSLDPTAVKALVDETNAASAKFGGLVAAMLAKDPVARPAAQDVERALATGAPLVTGGAAIVEEEEEDEADDVEPLFCRGDYVEARYKGNKKWYPGIVARHEGSDHYEIHYDDGDKEVNVSAELIRRQHLNHLAPSAVSMDRQIARSGSAKQRADAEKKKEVQSFNGNAHDVSGCWVEVCCSVIPPFCFTSCNKFEPFDYNTVRVSSAICPWGFPGLILISWLGVCTSFLVKDDGTYKNTRKPNRWFGHEVRQEKGDKPPWDISADADHKLGKRDGWAAYFSPSGKTYWAYHDCAGCTYGCRLCGND